MKTSKTKYKKKFSTGGAANAIPYVSMFKQLGEGIDNAVAKKDEYGVRQGSDFAVGVGGFFNPRDATQSAVNDIFKEKKFDADTALNLAAPFLGIVKANKEKRAARDAMLMEQQFNTQTQEAQARDSARNAQDVLDKSIASTGVSTPSFASTQKTLTAKTGGNLNPSIYRTGGSKGRYDLIDFKGPLHEEGGIKLMKRGGDTIEVEGGEKMIGNTILSDSIKYTDNMIKFLNSQGIKIDPSAKGKTQAEYAKALDRKKLKVNDTFSKNTEQLMNQPGRGGNADLERASDILGKIFNPDAEGYDPANEQLGKVLMAKRGGKFKIGGITATPPPPDPDDTAAVDSLTNKAKEGLREGNKSITVDKETAKALFSEEYKPGEITGGSLTGIEEQEKMALAQLRAYQASLTEALARKVPAGKMEEFIKNIANMPNFKNSNIDEYTRDFIAQYPKAYLTPEEVEKIAPDYYHLRDILNKSSNKLNIGTKGTGDSGDKEMFGIRNAIYRRGVPYGAEKYAYLENLAAATHKFGGKFPEGGKSSEIKNASTPEVPIVKSGMVSAPRTAPNFSTPNLIKAGEKYEYKDVPEELRDVIKDVPYSQEDIAKMNGSYFQRLGVKNYVELDPEALVYKHKSVTNKLMNDVLNKMSMGYAKGLAEIKNTYDTNDTDRREYLYNLLEGADSAGERYNKEKWQSLQQNYYYDPTTLKPYYKLGGTRKFDTNGNTGDPVKYETIINDPNFHYFKPGEDTTGWEPTEVIGGEQREGWNWYKKQNANNNVSTAVFNPDIDKAFKWAKEHNIKEGSDFKWTNAEDKEYNLNYSFNDDIGKTNQTNINSYAGMPTLMPRIEPLQAKVQSSVKMDNTLSNMDLNIPKDLNGIKSQKRQPYNWLAGIAGLANTALSGIANLRDVKKRKVAAQEYRAKMEELNRVPFDIQMANLSNAAQESSQTSGNYLSNMLAGTSAIANAQSQAYQNILSRNVDRQNRASEINMDARTRADYYNVGEDARVDAIKREGLQHFMQDTAGNIGSVIKNLDAQNQEASRVATMNQMYPDHQVEYTRSRFGAPSYKLSEKNPYGDSQVANPQTSTVSNNKPVNSVSNSTVNNTVQNTNTTQPISNNIVNSTIQNNESSIPFDYPDLSYNSNPDLFNRTVYNENVRPTPMEDNYGQLSDYYNAELKKRRIDREELLKLGKDIDPALLLEGVQPRYKCGGKYKSMKCGGTLKSKK